VYRCKSDEFDREGIKMGQCVMDSAQCLLGSENMVRGPCSGDKQCGRAVLCDHWRVTNSQITAHSSRCPSPVTRPGSSIQQEHCLFAWTATLNPL